MKVLILTYYWPPAGGSGVQRWLKFVKYLGQFDIEPIVYTVDNANYPILDPSLSKEIPSEVIVLKQPIKEPNNIFSFLKKKNNKSAGFLKKNPSLLEKVALYIRANYFVPDARKFWINPSVKYLNDYLKDHPVDLIISTGPPHSLHLIAKKLKEKTSIKWLADFRDPWTDIDYFQDLPLTKRARQKHLSLEQGVLTAADHIVVVGEQMRQNYLKFTKNISIISNGYDALKTDGIIELDTKFSMVHIGMLNADRNPLALWEAVAELRNEQVPFAENIRIKLIGKIADEVQDSLAKLDLLDSVEFEDYVVHQEALILQQKAQVLLLIVNDVPSAKGIVTGKIFEYLQAKRPILAVAPINGDLANIVNLTQAGSVFDHLNKQGIKEEINKLFNGYLQNNLSLNSHNIERYHCRALTEEMANLIKRICT